MLDVGRGKAARVGLPNKGIDATEQRIVRHEG